MSIFESHYHQGGVIHIEIEWTSSVPEALKQYKNQAGLLLVFFLKQESLVTSLGMWNFNVSSLWMKLKLYCLLLDLYMR